MNIKIIFFYVLFFMTAIIVFGFFNFPQKQVATMLSRELNRQSPLVKVSISNAAPMIPLGLNLEKACFLINETIQITPDSLKLLVSIPSLFNNQNLLTIRSLFNQGMIEGRFQLNKLTPISFSPLVLSSRAVDISNFQYSVNNMAISLDFKLNGEYTLEGENEKFPEPGTRQGLETGPGPGPGSGQGILDIENFHATLPTPLFKPLNISKLDFTSIKIDFLQNKKSMTISQCIAKGPLMNVMINGNITLMSPFETSILDLKGVILSDSTSFTRFANMASIKSVVKKDGIPFKIKGTLKNPNIGL